MKSCLSVVDVSCAVMLLAVGPLLGWSTVIGLSTTHTPEFKPFTKL